MEHHVVTLEELGVLGAVTANCSALALAVKGAVSLAVDGTLGMMTGLKKGYISWR
jgi:hypothetical protein